MLSLTDTDSDTVDRLADKKNMTPNGVVTAALKLFESVAMGQMNVEPKASKAKQSNGSSSGVVWHSTSDILPDEELTVVFAYGEPGQVEVWLGYLEGQQWHSVEGWAIEKPVRFWADLPDPPGKAPRKSGGASNA